MAPVLPAADEECLDAHLPRLAGQSEDVPVAKALGMDRLAALHIGQGAKPVSVHRRQLVILLFRGLGHQPPKPRLHPGRLSGQEQLRILD